MAQEDIFKKLVAHCKEYGYVFQSSEIYDGLAAVYDYGQYGDELKNNIKKYYNELQGFEKEIIETCLNSAILSYVTDPFDDDAYTTAIYSLVGKGFGHNISRGGDFIMYQEVYNQLSELKAKKK